MKCLSQALVVTAKTGRAHGDLTRASLAIGPDESVDRPVGALEVAGQQLHADQAGCARQQ